MQYLKKYQKPLEITAGLIFFLPCLKNLYNVQKMMNSLFKNYDTFQLLARNPHINYQKFMGNPGKMQYVLFENLSVKGDFQLFQQQMKKFQQNREDRQLDYNFAGSKNFMAEATSNNIKHKIFCKCDARKHYVSHELLFNIKSSSRHFDKLKITMLAYGELLYDKNKKQFVFEGDCFATSGQQIESFWKLILTIDMPVRMLAYGLGIGIGACLLAHNIATYQDLLRQAQQFYQQIQNRTKQNQIARSA